MLHLVFWLTFMATLLQLAYWLLFFSRLAYYRQGKNIFPAIEPPLPVSVIICARNEAENLRKNLPHVLEQEYPDFEVIVVDDNSSDKSWEILLDIKNKYPILQLIQLKEQTLPGKKVALSRGIEAARFERLLLTDADCRPVTKHWLSIMTQALQGTTEISLGYSPYNLHAGFLNIFIRFESIYTAIQYFSFALMKLPYMGVGRNLAYVKTLFRKHQGFTSHVHIASGDDDLFINQAANGQNTAIIIHPDTFVVSTPKSSWRSYYYQKSRHLTTGSRYKFTHQLLLGGLAGSHVMHYLGVLILLPTTYAPAVILMFLVRMGVVLWMYARILKLLRDPSLLRWIPLLDAAFTCYYLFFSPVLLLTTGNLKKWKL
ncbi:MAG: glycosyltransferase [Saprospiraceae bacterium]|nr:glycosyltransferase [Lewinella sp.]